MSWKFTNTFFLFLLNLIIKITSSSLVPKDFGSSLSNKFKSNLEFNFQKDYNPEFNEFDKIDDVDKYFHIYKNTLMNMPNGAVFKCYIPKKINKGAEILEKQNLIENLDEELATYLLRENSKMCYNSSFKEWFYKICPFNTAIQMLSYKKKDEQGLEYSEIFTLGVKNTTEYNIENYYRNKTGDNESINIPKIPYIVVNDKIGKIYNYDKDAFGKYDISVEVEYPKEKIQHMKKLKVNIYNKTVEEYMSENPDAKVIPIRRKIIKFINKHLVFFDTPFPYPVYQYNFNFNVIREKRKETNNNNNLLVYGDMIYCPKCEFLLYYSIGDSIAIRSNKFTESRRTEFTKKIYQSRIITAIYDNNLMRVHKKFDEEYAGLINKKNYFVVNSEFQQYKFKSGSGSLKLADNLIMGDNTQFIREVDEGDLIIPIDFSSLNEFSETVSVNLKRNLFFNYCKVVKIFSNSMILTEERCQKTFKYKGDYLIRKKFIKYPSTISIINKNEFNFFSEKALNEEPVLPDSNTDSIADSNENYFAPLDLDIPEVINVNRKFRNFFDNHTLFHFGFLVKNIGNTVFRFKVEKIANGRSKLLVNLGTKISNFINKLPDMEHDYQLQIDSDKGLILKKIRSENNNEDIEFFSNEIRSFFQESTYLDIILKDNHIYINTVDDDKETSIKLKYSLPEGESIKYIYLNTFDSDNISMKDMKKMNMIELKYLINIYIFEIRMRLSPDVKFIEKLENGDLCDNIGKNRTTTVEYRCDTKGINEVTIEKVSEPSMCDYKYHAKTKNLCNPHYTMYNKIQQSVAMTKCVVQNNEHNKNSEDYFEKA